jgi:DNA-binding GntR family transcriptional regulator
MSLLLKDKAYLALKQQILTGHLHSGDVLSERRLASELGMSKTPVREALERLLGEQFVSVAPQQGYVVRGSSIREVAEHFEFRMMLEPFFLRRAARDLTPQRARALSAQIEQQAAAVSECDRERAIMLDAEFHLFFARVAGNREMLRVMSRLCERMFRLVAEVFDADAARLAKNYEEHRQIAQAMLAGDAEQAVLILTEHLDHCRRTLLTRVGDETAVTDAEMSVA